MLSRLSKLDESTQNLTEAKNSIEEISKLQQALPTLAEIVDTLRKDLNHITESSSNKKLKHNQNISFMSPEDEKGKSTNVNSWINRRFSWITPLQRNDVRRINPRRPRYW